MGQSFTTSLKRTLFYFRCKFRFSLRNIVVRYFISQHRKGLDLSNVSRLTITGPSGKGRLALYLHAPPPTDTPGPRPVHINIHGGGYTMDLHGIDARFCQKICQEAGCYVVDADHRMAPDHPWPAPYEDIVRVVVWVRANEGGMFDTERITISGGSSGGNLALAVAGTAEEGVFKGVVAFYPITDWTVPYAEKPPPPVLKLEGSDVGNVISLEEGELFRDVYLLGIPLPYDPATLKDPRLSPKFAAPSRFPDKGRTMIRPASTTTSMPKGERSVKPWKMQGGSRCGCG